MTDFSFSLPSITSPHLLLPLPFSFPSLHLTQNQRYHIFSILERFLDRAPGSRDILHRLPPPFCLCKISSSSLPNSASKLPSSYALTRLSHRRITFFHLQVHRSTCTQGSRLDFIASIHEATQEVWNFCFFVMLKCDLKGFQVCRFRSRWTTQRISFYLREISLALLFYLRDFLSMLMVASAIRSEPVANSASSYH